MIALILFLDFQVLREDGQESLKVYQVKMKTNLIYKRKYFSSVQ